MPLGPAAIVKTDECLALACAESSTRDVLREFSGRTHAHRNCNEFVFVEWQVYSPEHDALEFRIATAYAVT